MTSETRKWPAWKLTATKGGRRIEEDSVDPVEFKYRYSIVHQERTQVGSWMPMLIADDRFSSFIHLNYATSMASLLNRNVEDLRAEDNVVISSSDYATHILEVRMTDAYGRVVTKSMEFRLYVSPAPVFVEIRHITPQQPSHKDFLRSHTSIGQPSGVELTFSWRNSVNMASVNASPRHSLVPDLDDLRVRMNDIRIFWRLEADVLGPGKYTHIFRMMQMVNFEYGNNEILLSPGTHTFNLKTTKMFEENTDGTKFMSALGSENTHIDRVVCKDFRNNNCDGRMVGRSAELSGETQWKIEAINRVLRHRKPDIIGPNFNSSISSAWP